MNGTVTGTPIAVITSALETLVPVGTIVTTTSAAASTSTTAAAVVPAVVPAGVGRRVVRRGSF